MSIIGLINFGASLLNNVVFNGDHSTGSLTREERDEWRSLSASPHNRQNGYAANVIYYCDCGMTMTKEQANKYGTDYCYKCGGSDVKRL
jgi:hypothetical protein